MDGLEELTRRRDKWADLFPSPDGELVGLDRPVNVDLAYLRLEEGFPSPDGELVGLY